MEVELRRAQPVPRARPAVGRRLRARDPAHRVIAYADGQAAPCAAAQFPAVPASFRHSHLGTVLAKQHRGIIIYLSEVRNVRLSFENHAGRDRRRIALGAAACGSSSPSAPTVAADVTISMVGDRGHQSFAPNPTTMRVGQTVRGRTTIQPRMTPRRTRRAFEPARSTPAATSSPRHDECRGNVRISLHDPPGYGGHARRAVTRLWQVVRPWLDRCFPTGLAGENGS